jgi:hypothetical protein
MWCPEDEEDDLFNSLTPNNPAFRAMERDIDDRHKRYVDSIKLPSCCESTNPRHKKQKVPHACWHIHKSLPTGYICCAAVVVAGWLSSVSWQSVTVLLAMRPSSRGSTARLFAATRLVLMHRGPT